MDGVACGDAGFCRNAQCAAFSYPPYNFVPGNFSSVLAGADFNCGLTVFNSTTRTWVNWCSVGAGPMGQVVAQDAGATDVNVIPLPTRITVDNVMDVIKDYDLVIDGSDNFETRYLVNDACYLAGKTNVHGSIFQFEGMATVFAPNAGPCYRCLYPTPPPPGLVPS